MRDPLYWLSVKYKLALGFVGLCTLAFGVGGYLMSNSARDALQGEILQRLEFQSQAYAADLHASLELLKRRSEDFASDGYIRDHLARLVTASDGDARAQLATDLHRHLRVNKLPLEDAFIDLAVVSAVGEVAVAVEDASSAAIVQLARWSVLQDESRSSNALASAGGVPFLVITTPVYGLRSGEPIGRLLAKVRARAWVSLALQSQRLGRDRAVQGVGLRLHDSQDRVLLIPSEFLHAAELPSAAARSESGPFRLVTGEEFNASGIAGEQGDGILRQEFPIGSSGWSAEVTIKPDLMMEALSGLQSEFLLVGVILACFSALLLFFPLRFLARPLMQLREAALRIREGDFSPRVEVRSGDEVGDLAESFNLMAGAVEARTHALEQTATDLRHRQNELLTERDRLDRVISTMQDGLVVLNPNGEVELSNHAAGPLLEMLQQMEADEVVSHHPCQSPGRDGEQDCRHCLAHPDRAARSCTLDYRDRVIDVHATPLPAGSDGRRGRILVGRDVTDRVSREEGEVHQERLAVLGEVAAVMAHELNNPLASICLFNQMLGARLPDDSELQENVEVINRNAETCKKVIGELLGYSGATAPEIGPVDLHETLQDVARFLRPLAERNGVQVLCTLEAGHSVVHGDEVQLRQIFVNLVVNAIQAAEGDAQVELCSDDQDGMLVVQVCDSGPGIPAPAREQIFRPFYTTKARGEGTGLGLSTARRLAELHGGGLELIRSGPRGTIFQVRLRAMQRAAGE